MSYSVMSQEIDTPPSDWPEAAKDVFLERIAIMRDGNNVPMDAPTPAHILLVATTEALENGFSK